jgi:hypothetical protein
MCECTSDQLSLTEWALIRFTRPNQGGNLTLMQLLGILPGATA